MTDTTTIAKGNVSAEVAHDMAIVEKDPTVGEPAVDAQLQSPLFSKLPPEIRNQLYELVMAPFQDMTRCFDQTSICWRPESQAPVTIELRVLVTCKRVYQESEFARTLALQKCDFHLRPAKTVAFLFTKQPVPPQYFPFYRVDNHLIHIPGAQKAHIKSIFIQDVKWLAYFQPGKCPNAFHNLKFGAIQPRHLTLVRSKLPLDDATRNTFSEI